MEITLKELEEIFGDVVSKEEPWVQRLFLELNEGVVKENGLQYLRQNREYLLAQWDHIVNGLL
jgi:hypothetical protein